MPPGPAGARHTGPTIPAVSGPPSGLRRTAIFALSLALPALAGCATGTAEQSWWNPSGLGPAPTSPPPATNVVLPARAADPLAAFAARARTGQAESVMLPSGRPVSARLVRTYNAASGRECRELQFGPTGVAGGPPGATYCNDPAQGWVAARALLRGGAVYRP
ncbi:MAG TPA: hypothetical protein VIL69_10035 [Roseomonas sp.]